MDRNADLLRIRGSAGSEVGYRSEHINKEESNQILGFYHNSEVRWPGVNPYQQYSREL